MRYQAAFLALLVAFPQSPADESRGGSDASPETQQLRTGIPADGNGVWILSKNEPAYRAIALPDDARAAPDAALHLVVFRGGVPVFDRGLRDESRIVSAPSRTVPTIEEEVLTEDAEVSADGRSAVILTTSLRRPTSVEGKPDPDAESKTRGRTEVTWIDAANPQGLWTVVLEENRWVKAAAALGGGRGVVLATCASPDAPADLRILDGSGAETFRMAEAEAGVLGLSTARHGGFLAVDLAFPDRQGVPDRGILVLDLLQGTRWTYTWSYGDDDEPSAWALTDAGILEIRRPDQVRRFDRVGRSLRSATRR